MKASFLLLIFDWKGSAALEQSFNFGTKGFLTGVVNKMG